MRIIPQIPVLDNFSPKKTKAIRADAPGLRANTGDTVEISISRKAFATKRKEIAAKNPAIKITIKESLVILEKSKTKIKGREKTKLSMASEAENSLSGHDEVLFSPPKTPKKQKSLLKMHKSTKAYV